MNNQSNYLMMNEDSSSSSSDETEKVLEKITEKIKKTQNIHPLIIIKYQNLMKSIQKLKKLIILMMVRHVKPETKPLVTISTEIL